MASIDLNDKEFHAWAVKKLAYEVRLEELESFCKKMPPEELKHLYKVIEERLIPILHSEGIPIQKEQAFRIFRIWFLETMNGLSPEVKRSLFSPEDETEAIDRYYLKGPSSIFHTGGGLAISNCLFVLRFFRFSMMRGKS